jgi:hypothetical protein
MHLVPHTYFYLESPRRRAPPRSILAFAAMASSDNLIAELEVLPAYMKESMDLGISEVDLLAAHAADVKEKIGNLSDCTMVNATRIQQAIKACPFDKATNKELAQCINAAVTHLAAGTGSAIARPQQKCMNFELYPTDTDWAIIGDPSTPWSTKYAVVVSLCRKLNLVLPSEKTRVRMVECMLLASNMPLERDQEFFRCKDKLAAALAPLQKEKVQKYNHLQVYPSEPKLLPTDLYAKVYNTGGPALREFSVLTTACKDFRKSSSAYKALGSDMSPLYGGQTCRPQISPHEQANAFAVALSQAIGPMFQNIFAGMGAPGASGSSGSSGPDAQPWLRIFGPRGNVAQGAYAPGQCAPLVAGDGCQVVQTPAVPQPQFGPKSGAHAIYTAAASRANEPMPGESPAAKFADDSYEDDDVDGFVAEDTACAVAMSAKAEKAKLTAAAKKRPAAAAEVTKRPAAIADSDGEGDGDGAGAAEGRKAMKAAGGAKAKAMKAASMKRPAAAEPTLPKGFKLDLREHLTKAALRSTCSEGAYTSKAHSLGEKQAKAKDLDPETVKEVRKIAYRMAKEFWDKHA